MIHQPSQQSHLLPRALAAFLLAMTCRSVLAASTLITNANIVDGTGAPARMGAVRLDAGRIVGVGNLSPRSHEQVIDAHGFVLAPGFIDSHSHHDDGIFERRAVPEAISQGITTIVAGQDGWSEMPLQDFFQKFSAQPASVNVASYVGHEPLRSTVMGKDFRRAATPAELSAMRELLARDMRAGALGLSTGLEYEPGSYSSPEEVVALAREAARFGGRYISHMRSEDLKLDKAIEELLAIGREACLPVQISHFKLAVRTRWGEATQVLARLDRARDAGVDVTADVYPYEFWQSTLTVLFPEHDYEDREVARYALENIAAPEDLILTEFEAEPALVGKSVAQVAQLRGTDSVTTLIALIRQSQTFGAEGAEETVMGRSMSAADIATLIAWPHTNISSDGSMLDAHPRGAGTFTRVLRLYVREQHRLSLEAAIHKMTGLTAAHVGLADRGVIRPGAYADLVLFDPATVADRATIEHPDWLSTGITRVWVNGQTVWNAGQPTNTYSGQVLRRTRMQPFVCPTGK
jgi:N-acyl-D-amino-acid deacylase